MIMDEIKYDLINDVDPRLANQMANAADSDLAQPFVLVLMALSEPGVSAETRRVVLGNLAAVCDRVGVRDDDI